MNIPIEYVYVVAGAASLYLIQQLRRWLASQARRPAPVCNVHEPDVDMATVTVSPECKPLKTGGLAGLRNERAAIRGALADAKKEIQHLSGIEGDVSIAVAYQQHNFADLNHRLGQVEELIEEGSSER